MASVPISLGTVDAVIRWAVSKPNACIKEPLEGRGLLVAFEPSFTDVDDDLWERLEAERKASCCDHAFASLDYNSSKDAEMSEELFDEWSSLGLPRMTLFVAYSAAVAANPAMKAHRDSEFINIPPATVLHVWDWWIEGKGGQWMLHWPGMSTGKLAYESKQLAKDFAKFIQAWKPKAIHVRNRLRIADGHSEYSQAFDTVKQSISAGEYYLANLTTHFGAGLSNLTVGPRNFDVAELYLRLRRISPSPQGCLFTLDQGEYLLSASPERLIKATNLWVDDVKTIETHPIKGTRPVFADPVANQRAIADLVSSEKENAELTMIVDLERNDLSRLCLPHTVVVDGGFRVESTPHVHHRVATVKGQAYNALEVGDILAATFPGGSVTGAPKVATVNALEAIEHVCRGAYCGSILWVGVDGTIDSSILIRTIYLSDVTKEPIATFGSGGGITIDSDPDAEYLECFQKAQAMAEALEPWVDITMVRDALAGRGFPQQRDWWTLEELEKEIQAELDELKGVEDIGDPAP